LTFNLLQPSGFDVLTSPGFPRGGALLGLAACLATGLRLRAAVTLAAAHALRRPLDALANAFGFEVLTHEGFEAGAKYLLKRGYR